MLSVTEEKKVPHVQQQMTAPTHFTYYFQNLEIIFFLTGSKPEKIKRPKALTLPDAC